MPSLNVQTFEEFNSKISALQSETDFFHVDIAKRDFTQHEIGIAPKDLDRVGEGLRFEVHLMQNLEPLDVRPWLKNSVKRIIFHLKATSNPTGLIKVIKKEKKESWVALLPEESPEVLHQYSTAVDGVLLLEVLPGPVGQKPIEDLGSAEKRAEAIHLDFPDFKIAFDGGISEDNIALFNKAGFDHVVVASAIFASGNPKDNYENLVNLLKSQK